MTETEKLTEKKPEQGKREKKTPIEPSGESSILGMIPNVHFFIVDAKGRPTSEVIVKRADDNEEGVSPMIIRALSNPTSVIAALDSMNPDDLSTFAGVIAEIHDRVTERMVRFNSLGDKTVEKPVSMPSVPPKPVEAEKPTKPINPAKPTRRGGRRSRAETEEARSVARHDAQEGTIKQEIARQATPVEPILTPAPAPAKPTEPTPPATTMDIIQGDFTDIEREIMAYLNGSPGMSFGDLSQKTNQKGKALFNAIQSLMTKRMLVKGDDMLFRRADH